MNVNFNPNRGIAASFQNQLLQRRNKPLINPILKPTLTYPSPTLQSPMLANQNVSSLSAQPIGLKKSPAAECRDLCGDNGVKEYLSNSTTDGNVGVQVNKGGKAGVGINGSHENKDVCVCYPPQLTK